MADKEHICAYKYCLHHGDKVKTSESVVINKKHYHWDCAELKQKIKECADLYISYVEDKSRYPTVVRIINTLVLKNGVPVDYILQQISYSGAYYADKPVHILYGLRKLFWMKEMKT